MSYTSSFISVASSTASNNSSLVYLVDWILALVLGLAFVFYFNRLVGFVVSLILRILLWKKYQVLVNIESLRVAPLGGLIAAKNVTIINNDYTVSILQLNFTWRYWISHHTRLPEFLIDDGPESDGLSKEDNNKLPARMLLQILGLEVYMHNRTAAYDNMEEILKRAETNEKESVRYRTSSRSSQRSLLSAETKGSSVEPQQVPDSSLLIFLKVFPLAVRIRKGAFIMGNVTTPTILVASFKAANSICDVTRAASVSDVYRRCFKFEFENFQVSMKPNISYDKNRFSSPNQVSNAPAKHHRYYYRVQRVLKFVLKVSRKVTRRDKKVIETPQQWRGLNRYIGTTDDADKGYVGSVLEYAKYSLILDSVSTSMVYYYDLPGLVSDETTFPEFGVDIELSMATVHYGPWADKQRVPLQNMFFPSAARDLTPSKPGVSGQLRLYAGFRVSVLVKDEMILRIPTRESSKDAEMAKNQMLNANQAGQKISRPFGWVELKVESGSVINTFNSFLASTKGWENKLYCRFNQPEVRTSVNHDILLMADTHTVEGEIGFPLEWNGHTKWSFENCSNNVKIFFLREHTMLFSDVFSDFLSGTPTPYEYIKLMDYHVRWKMCHYKLYLNVNDQNIINSPLDFNNNKYVSFQGSDFVVDTTIPQTLAKSTTVSYHMFTSHFDMVLDTPPWHTANAFMTKSKVMAQGSNYTIDGSYTFFSGVEIGTTNYIVLHAKGDFMTMKFHGFFIRYLFVVRENYLGDHKHFITLDEYVERERQREEEDGQSCDLDPESDWKSIKTENDSDVLFTFKVRHGLMVFPYNIYDSLRHVGLRFDSLDVDFRDTNCYMDLQANFSPMTGCFSTDDVFDIENYRPIPAVHIDGFGVHTHRMFGAGLHELTYYCKWDFSCESIEFDTDMDFLTLLKTCVQNFALGFQDLENCLVFRPPSTYDAANFLFRCPQISIKLDTKTDNTFVHLDLGPLLANYNDMANTRYTAKADVSMRKIIMTVVQHDVVIGKLHTSLIFNIIMHKAHFASHRRLQQKHVRAGDGPTHRVPFILFGEYRDPAYEGAYGSVLAAFSLPDASYPLNDESNRVFKGHSDEFHPFGQHFEKSFEVADDDETPKFVAPDLDHKCLSFILDFTKVESQATPEALVTLAALLDTQELDPHSLMDTLQAEATKYLKKVIAPPCEIDLLRLVCPEVDFQLIKDIGNPEAPLVVLLKLPSVAMSSKQTRSKNGSELVQEIEIDAAFHVKEVRLHGENAATVSVDDFEAWMSQQDETIGSVSVGSIDGDIYSIEFGEIRRILQPAISAFKKLNKPDWRPHFVHGLTLAADTYRVDHDPGVLTKPVPILRACEEHVRFYDRWKLVTRLRHILDTVPAVEQVSSENALASVLASFLEWRNWEGDANERERYAREIFTSKSEEKKPGHWDVAVDSVGVQVDEDYVLAKTVALTVSTGDGIDVVAMVSSFDGQISDLLARKVQEQQDIEAKSQVTSPEQTPEPNDPDSPKSSSSNTLDSISLVINIKSAHQQLKLRSTHVQLDGQGLMVSFLRQSGSSVVCAKSQALELGLFHGEHKLFSCSGQEFDLVLVDAPQKLVDIVLEEGHVEVLDTKSTLAKSLHGVLEDVNWAKQMLKKKEEVEENESISSESPREIPPFIANFALNKFTWYAELLPVKLSGAAFGHKLLAKYDSVANIEFGFDKVEVDAKLHKIHVVHLENSDLFYRVALAEEENRMCKVVSKLGYTKLHFPQITESYEVVVLSQKAVLQRVEEFKKLGRIIMDKSDEQSPDSQSVDSQSVSVKSKPLVLPVFQIMFSNDYVGVSASLNKSRMSFEIDNLSLTCSNISGINGSLLIASARVSLVNRNVPVGLSNVLDLNLNVKVTTEDSLQNLQIESQFCRVCLSPPIVLALTRIYDEVVKSMRKHPMDFKRPVKSDASPHKSTFSTVHVLAYNFCIGWIFGDNKKDYPGLILGAERVFAVTKQDMGKLSMMEGYLSVANGYSSSNFFSSLSEKDNLNRAFLPTMQLIYVTEKEKQIKVSIQGDQLDVKFLSNSVVLLEYAVNSVTKIQKVFEERQKLFPKEEQKQKQAEQEPKENSDSLGSLASLGASYSWIELTAKYEGSNVRFYRLAADDHEDSPPSLFLHSPAVKISSFYKHDKHAEKHHVFKTEVLTISSDNTLYASCVPVIMDIADGIKSIMRKTGPLGPSPSSNDRGFDISQFMQDIDFHFGMKIESQKLSLSCEPTAKVAAVVGLDGIYIQVHSSDNDTSAVAGTVRFDSVSASLQHIYSREVSGSIGIDNVILSTSVSFNPTNVFSAGTFSKVRAFINVKQYQDLELFKDIWIPKKANNTNEATDDETGDNKSRLASNRNISSRFREVSTTYALPWVLTFLVLDISLQVDFGQSLGNFDLKSDRFWAVSKKSTNWAQDLKLGIDGVHLVSKGRLGGYISMNSAHLHTAISWKLNSQTLDVPLILVSGGIDKLQMKISFDFHVFAIAYIQGYSIDVFNQKNEVSLSKDHLFVTVKLDVSEFYITALAASNFFDIYNTVNRMIQENRQSYKETLIDSNKNQDTDKYKNNTASKDILETVKRLETKIRVVAGRFVINVYPSSFDDSKVLVCKLNDEKANFQQSEYVHGISNSLEIVLNDLRISLSKTLAVLNDFIQQCTVDEFVEHARRATGGGIFTFPRFMVSMRTFQKYESNTIEYLYQSSFGGTVDIRWNLGSINFIREMYSIHSKALRSRTEYSRMNSRKLDPESIQTNTGPSPSLQKQVVGEDVTDEIDEAINKKMSEVSKSKYSYKPLAPAIIEEPRLRELGNATPPLEWFGVHRDGFPDATHQVTIIPLQKLIHEVELQYSKILGKA